MRLYLIGSLRNRNVPRVAERLRAAGHEVHDDWFAAGRRTDDWWQRYERGRGHNFGQALRGRHAETVFDTDVRWLMWSDAVVMVLPAGKSAHLEFGWAARDRPGHILLDGEPDRMDIMYRFALESGGGVWYTVPELLLQLRDRT